LQRCICGRSARLPVCDGSHRDAGWRCAEATVHGRVFAAGHHAQALAERLAHARGGSALQRLDGGVRAAELVVVTDGSDLGALQPELARVEARRTRVVVIGADHGLLTAALPGAELLAVEDTTDPALLWHRIANALDGPAIAPVDARPPRLFVSHAVSDEPRLAPVARALRALGIEVFLCGDSIRSGSDWRERIVEALRAADRFVLVLSAASRESTWCAFEAGVAVALGTPVQVLSLDGTDPPSFLAHLQMDDLARMRGLRPWLDADEALIDALLARRG
jgi:hypothetical protein